MIPRNPIQEVFLPEREQRPKTGLDTAQLDHLLDVIQRSLFQYYFQVVQMLGRAGIRPRPK